MKDGEDVFIAPWWLARSLLLVWVWFFVLDVIVSIEAFRLFNND